MLKVYNTLTRKKEEFVPQEEGKVGIYVCGVTPYNFPHIGNARPFVTWDVIKRYLKAKGYEVKHIQNFTDMDDKIIKAANTEGVSWQTITERYIKGYFDSIPIEIEEASKIDGASNMQLIRKIILPHCSNRKRNRCCLKHMQSGTRQRRRRWVSISMR